MLNINVLKNGGENNIIEPRVGDIGWDLVVDSIKVKGNSINNGETELSVNNVEELKNIFWRRIDYIQYGTNIKYQLEKAHEEWNPTPINYYGQVVPRSSISKYSLTLANAPATIDLGYLGEVMLRFRYILQPEDMILEIPGGNIVASINTGRIYNIGDKCAQVVFHNFTRPSKKIVENLSDTVRGEGGFGSTGQ